MSFFIAHLVISFSRDAGKVVTDAFDVNFVESLMKPSEDTSNVSTSILEPAHVGVKSFCRFSYFFLLYAFDLSIFSSWQIVNSQMIMVPVAEIRAISGRRFLKIFDTCSAFCIPARSTNNLEELEMCFLSHAHSITSVSSCLCLYLANATGEEQLFSMCLLVWGCRHRGHWFVRIFATFEGLKRWATIAAMLSLWNMPMPCEVYWRIYSIYRYSQKWGSLWWQSPKHPEYLASLRAPMLHSQILTLFVSLP